MKHLTPEDVSKMLAVIYGYVQKRDDEAAHSAEDHMRFNVLQAIAHDTCSDPRKCADMACRSQGLDFVRWSA